MKRVNEFTSRIACGTVEQMQRGSMPGFINLTYCAEQLLQHSSAQCPKVQMLSPRFTTWCIRLDTRAAMVRCHSVIRSIGWNSIRWEVGTRELSSHTCQHGPRHCMHHPTVTSMGSGSAGFLKSWYMMRTLAYDWVITCSMHRESKILCCTLNNNSFQRLPQRLSSV